MYQRSAIHRQSYLRSQMPSSGSSRIAGSPISDEAENGFTHFINQLSQSSSFSDPQDHYSPSPSSNIFIFAAFLILSCFEIIIVIIVVIIIIVHHSLPNFLTSSSPNGGNENSNLYFWPSDNQCYNTSIHPTQYLQPSTRWCNFLTIHKECNIIPYIGWNISLLFRTVTLLPVHLVF